jgi:hydroxymethylpyrimidine/phosphomethylpyrimidine kinase
LKGDLSAYDVAVINGKSHFYESERIANIKTHGTGCTLSAAITAFLARNYSLNDAIANAKKWVHHCIMYSYQWNKNNQWIDALNHSVCQNINHL